jgi:hypothetical protein
MQSYRGEFGAPPFDNNFKIVECQILHSEALGVTYAKTYKTTRPFDYDKVKINAFVVKMTNEQQMYTDACSKSQRRARDRARKCPSCIENFEIQQAKYCILEHKIITVIDCYRISFRPLLYAT